MSRRGWIYCTTVVGSWSAFLGWIVAEFLNNRGYAGEGRLGVAQFAALVGGAIGAGLSIFDGVSEPRRGRQAGRFVAGLLIGGIGGAVGGFVGDTLFTDFRLPRALGWMIMGAGIGVAVGHNDRSLSKLRNSLIGGSLGGLIGGILFGPILALIASGSGMSSRATAFAVLGMCIGLAIGLFNSFSWKPRLADHAQPSTQPVN